jgi:hypothetical protein
MKKLLLVTLALGISGAFASNNALESTAMSACMKKGGTEAQCQAAASKAEAKKAAGTN